MANMFAVLIAMFVSVVAMISNGQSQSAIEHTYSTGQGYFNPTPDGFQCHQTSVLGNVRVVTVLLPTWVNEDEITGDDLASFEPDPYGVGMRAIYVGSVTCSVRFLYRDDR